MPHATATAPAAAAIPAGPPPPYTRVAGGLMPIPVFTTLEITDPAVARRFDALGMSFMAKTKLMQLIKSYKYLVANKQKVGPKGKCFRTFMTYKIPASTAPSP